MIRRPTGCFRVDPVKAKLAQIEIEFLNKNVDHDTMAPGYLVSRNNSPMLQRQHLHFMAYLLAGKYETAAALLPHPIPPQIAQESTE